MTLCLVFLLILFYFGALIILEKHLIRNCLYVCMYICMYVCKGTNGCQKTYEIFHVYCIFYSGFMCQTTIIFGITKDGSLVLNTLAS